MPPHGAVKVVAEKRQIMDGDYGGAGRAHWNDIEGAPEHVEPINGEKPCGTLFP